MLVFKAPPPTPPPPPLVRTGAPARGLATPQLDDYYERVAQYLHQYLGGQEARYVYLAGQRIHDLNERALFYATVVAQIEQDLRGEPRPDLQRLALYKWEPVGVREFICSPQYLNKAQEIYPAILAAAEELNNGQYVEAVMTGGIGSGKTTLALYTNAYQLYLLSCMRSPHKLFGLDPSSEILLIFQSITKTLAQGVDYQRFRNMIEGCQYFYKHFPFDKSLESKLVFPNRVEVIPVAGTETAAIGQNVMGGLIDELNYMAVVEKSKVAVDKGTYDQAILVYNSIARRRKSRFMENGKLPGILCLVSSKKYPGQFTDQKVAEAEKDPTIFVYDKRVWDIKPDDFGNQGWFHVFVGDLTRKPKLLEPEDDVPYDDRPLVISVPLEFRTEFEKDLINALREIAGVSTLARHPFFLEVDKVHRTFRKDHLSIFSQSPVDFVETRLTLHKAHFHQPHLPRFCHVDLALSGDSAGVAIGTCTGFQEVTRSGATSLYMPVIRFDGVLEIRPPKNSEILFSKIREMLLALVQMGLQVRWVTFDQFQSTDSKQILQQAGFVTGQQSMDELPCRPYDFTKTAMYEGRVSLPYHLHVQKEILMLEKDTKSGKIDHIPGGCFTGETRVALANGTCPTFKELASKPPEEVFYLYAMTPHGVIIAPAHHARVTKTVQLIAEVLLDNYQVVRCTPEHLFMTLSGNWVAAEDLIPDVPIMPLYRQVSFTGGWKGYERVWCPIRQHGVLTHQLAYGPTPKGYVVHHEDKNKRNNDPRNLKALARGVHLSHHGNQAWAGKQQAMKEGFEKYWQQDVNMAKQSNLMKELWLEGKLKAHRTSHQTNHRVLAVTMVESHEEVYDLSVPGWENFALASGVFVHNSKDCADAVAGVVYGLTMRREIWGLYRIPLIMMPAGLLSAPDKLKGSQDQPDYQKTIEPTVEDTRDSAEAVRRRVLPGH